MRALLSIFFKGVAMGAANVIPGVSGGTIALLTGIFERLINAIKSFNLEALKLLFQGRFRELARHLDLLFLIALMVGVALSILTIARLFDFLFINYPVYLWSFFFGLILASVYFVGKTVERFSFSTGFAFLIGAATAVSISLLSPAAENANPLYLLICGAVAACSMVLPGLSGSFVLVLMGNYQLVMIDAVNQLNLAVLLPVIAGAGLGLLGFSYLLSWIIASYRDQTISLLTGFILGSLAVLWPWKSELYKTDAAGELILKSGGERIVEGYQWHLPAALNSEVLIALLLAAGGVVLIVLLEKAAAQKEL